MDCPQCNGEVYDNRQKVAGGWKGPLYKCRDKDGCGWVKWPPKGERSGGGSGAGKSANGAGSVRSTRPLGPLYYACMKIAAATVKQHIGDKATPTDIIAATATLFIGATNTGAPLAPPPKPAPEPVQQEDDGGSMGGDGYEF